MSNKLIKNGKKASKEISEMNDEDIAKGKKLFWLGVPVMGVAFAFLLLGCALQNRNYPWLDLVVVAGFAIFSITALILMIKNYFYVVYDEAVKMDRKYDSQELHKISLTDIDGVKQKFLDHKFQMQDDGWLVKRKFSVLKDSISYCISFTESNDIEKTLQRQLEHIDMNTKKGSSFCLILFAYMDGISKKTKTFVKNYGTHMIISENAFFSHMQMTAILVAVNKQTQEGWYMDIGKKHRISLYAHGCRLIKKYLGID